jgi:LacI family transcriptional regulator
MNKVTLKDIAIRTGFTINTVSRALKDKEDISLATRKLIQHTAKEMGYIANSLAGSLRSGQTKTIAIILGDISNPFFGIMAKEIERAAQKHNYTSFVINTEEDSHLEEKSIFTAVSKNVDGIILCPTQRNEDNIRFLQKTGIPFVLLGRYFPDPSLDYVVCDDKKGGYLATRHLLGKGHTKIVYLNAPAPISSSKERLEGYKHALQKANIPFDQSLVKEVGITSGDCRHTVKKLIEDGTDFTGIFAFSDMIAWETIYTLNKLGLRVPEDYGVVGFDNIQSRLFFPFPLTTISNSKSKMARRALDILMHKINHSGEQKPFHEVLDTHLVIREST